MIFAIVGAGAGAASRYGSGFDQMMRLRLRNTGKKCLTFWDSTWFRIIFYYLFSEYTSNSCACFLYRRSSVLPYYFYHFHRKVLTQNILNLNILIVKLNLLSDFVRELAWTPRFLYAKFSLQKTIFTHNFTSSGRGDLILSEKIPSGHCLIILSISKCDITISKVSVNPPMVKGSQTVIDFYSEEDMSQSATPFEGTFNNHSS
jgi:hypothetical protein